MIKQNKQNFEFEIIFVLIVLVLSLLIVFFSFFSSPVNGGIGQPNVTVITMLQVGNTYPEVLNVSIDNGAASVTLIPNSTKLVQCIAVLRDYNNDSDFNYTIAKFFDMANSTYSGADDKNYHYSNTSCNITRNFTSWGSYTDDEFLALANCTFDVWYYANASTWNCTVTVNDSIDWEANGSDTITIDQLLAIWLPDTINYGTVNATYVSNENITNVSNAGNVKINLSLSGYGFYEGDGNSMNCTKGNIKNISVDYEKYNLTTSTAGTLSLTEFEGVYVNLTSAPVVKKYELNRREDDNNNDATNFTYWRIYVPVGVAGTCKGNIIFGATQATGS